MNRILYFFRDARFLPLLGLLFVLIAIYVIGTTFDFPIAWVYAGWAITSLAWGGYFLARWMLSRRAGNAMESMFATQADEAVKAATNEKKQEIDILRKRLLEAVTTIKTSKLGQTTGSAALYEMPWHIVIGNPAAGKSTAVLNSGLNFPFSDKGAQALQGIGGTRNCDWFFTTEGILLDTAGRYAVHEEDRTEWFGFLNLLKKHRPKAPINGIVIVASIAELTGNRPDFAINLAKQLRQRVQELTEKLELFAPVYVMFTKVDLIAGFVDFFEDSDADERSRVWGATLPYDADGKSNAVSLFDQHFDTLAEGVKELGTTRMSLNRGDSMSPGALTFPLEFVGIKQHLRTFVATLFEDNPFQFKPIFRGFYFTSAIQEGVATHATGERIVQQFGLSAGRRLSASISSNSGFFLKNLFSSVIFADRNLVRQYASRRKIQLRYAAFYGAVLVLGLAIGGWGWSFIGNRQYVANIEADLANAVKTQENRLDLASRMEALGIIQDRLQQLEQFRDGRPISLAFGMYQGERVEHKLRAEYFKGLQQIMLEPVAANLESFLSDVNANAGKLEAPVRTVQVAAGGAAESEEKQNPKSGSSIYKDATPTNAEDAYNALKTYLMLANQERVEPGHLNDQLTRFWRNWLENNRGDASREQMIRNAEKLITFYLSQAGQPDFPLIENKLALVDQARETLKAVVKGTPARERVYSEIKMRAATRFPIVTAASIVGEQHKDIIAASHSVSGAFTRDAWEQYVQDAIKDASTKELQTADWVLKTAVKDDLSLEGSPEQIQQELVRMYKADYAREWKKFMQGILIADFGNFENAVQHMNVLGDPVSSPINSMLQTLYRETSWDNPSLVNQGLQGAKRGLVGWFKETIMRQRPSQVQVNLGSGAGKTTVQMGAVGKEFAAIANLVIVRGENKDLSLMKGYLEHLSKVRTRFNQISNSGDFGPASRQLMQATMDGNGSELADALKYVDENMLTGMPPAERATIRPLLVRPLMQAFAVIITPAEQELNRTWHAQVYEPFSRSLGTKYPFAADSRVEATPGEIAQVFGPDGAIAKYVQGAMGPLVIRRGDTLATRTWADMGVRLNPEFSSNLARFVAPQGAGNAGGGASNTQPQTNFQLQPVPTPGLVEYTVEIDGQSMRYRNGQQDWNNFSWPNAHGIPGAKITAVTADGRNIEIANFPGQFGLEKLINSSQRKKLDNGIFMMSWSGAQHQVSVRFRLISDSRSGTDSSANGSSDNGLRGLKLPASVAGKTASEQAFHQIQQARS